MRSIKDLVVVQFECVKTEHFNQELDLHCDLSKQKSDDQSLKVQ